MSQRWEPHESDPFTTIATSETVTGIAMGFSARMQQFAKPLGGERFRFVMDVEETDIPFLSPYKKALAEWEKQHQQCH